MPSREEMAVCYPVWRHAHRRDPHKAAMRRILRDYAHDLDHAARLIAGVIDMARGEAAAAASKQPGEAVL